MLSIRQVARRFRKAPGFTAVTLVTLAVGIGANTAIFSVLNGVLLKPLPFPEPDRLVGVWETAPGVGIKDMQASPATYLTFREEGRVFEDIGMWRTDTVTVTGLAEPEQVDALTATDGLLPLLGIQPQRGRWFTRQDDSPGSPLTVMLTYGYWQRRFGGQASAIGRTLMVDGKEREVIGVMPRKFRFLNAHPDLIVPFQIERSKVFIGNFSYYTLARLKPGATVAQANGDVARMLPMMANRFPPPPGFSMKIFEQARIGPNVRPLKQDVVGDVGKVLWVVMATVAMVLLIACANVANLLLVRAEGRRQELAIRAALGAGWSALARELLSESLALGAMGGVLGLGFAYGALRLLVALSPANLPRLEEISIDTPVLLFTVAVALVSGLLFGLLPVFKYAAGTRLALAMRDGGRGSSAGRERHRARNVLVVVQVALALVLLVGSGLMIRTLQALRHVEPGFTAPEQVLTLRVPIPPKEVPEGARVLRVQDDILQKIAAIPGVTAAGASSSITMDGYTDMDPIFAEDRSYAETQLPPMRRHKYVSPGYFHAMGSPLMAGRDFTWTDLHQGHPVILISQNLARELWGSAAAAIGKRVRENPKGVWREIIGVTGDERDDGVDHPAPTCVYWPLLVAPFWGFPERIERDPAFAVRSTRAGSASLLKEVERAVWSVNPNLPVAEVHTVGEIYAKSMARTSFTLVMLAMPAGMALLLGVVGVYGVISYSVSQRTREIGVRVALGASPARVLRMFVGHGLALAGAGVACGLAAAYGLTALMSSLLFGVNAVDPLTYGVVSAVLIAAAAMAAWFPAHRATAIAPVEALRAE
jgi:predicted permease